jgi:two-component system sensor histidine kinase KdpD
MVSLPATGSASWSLATRLTLALLACAAATVVVLLLPRSLWLPSGVLVYLVAVLGVSVLLGRGAGLAAAIASFLALDSFIVEPRFTLTITDPNEWVALVAFLVVALVTSQLAAGQRDRVLEAESREREARLLHDLTDLLAWRSFSDALNAVSERLRAELRAEAVRISVSPEGGVGALAEAGTADGLAALRALPGPMTVLGEGNPATAARSGSPGRWMRVMPAHRPPGTLARNIGRVPIRRDNQVLGHVQVQWRSHAGIGDRQARLLDSAAGQIAVAAERERLRLRALDAEVFRRTSELRSALLDAVSHDLRTPLSSIIGSAGSLLQSDVQWTAAERREFLETIEHEADRLNRIVANLLDLSRVQTGTLVPARDWHDPSLVLHESMHRLATITKDHRLEVDIPDDLPPVFLDPVEVDQVLANLVENAVKYSPAGTVIRVAAVVENGELRVSVEDGGPGVPDEAMPRLFEPFYRAPTTRAGSGSGVGLAVARGLVEAHGGVIEARNVNGRGARFSFSIPSAPLDREPAP